MNFEGQAEGIAPDTLIDAILAKAKAETDVKIGVYPPVLPCAAIIDPPAFR